jgi:threonine dehydrogenase-like Zn-dependent dehydrogenase
VRAVVHDTAGPTMAERPDPPAVFGEIVVEMSRVLLRASDHASESRRRGALGIPGSCLVGRDPNRGLVAIDPVLPCGRCTHCASGLAAACPQRTVIGGRGRDGGLAERVAVPEANLHPLPAELDPDLATLAVPVGIGLALARRLRLAEAAHLSVIGDGIAALAAAAALSTRHPATRLLSDDPFTAGLAAKWSLKHRGLAEAGRRHDQEALAIFSSSSEALAIAAGMLRPRGRVAWCVDGVAPNAEGLDRLRWIEGELLGHATTSIAEALSLLTRPPFDPAPLLRRRIELAEAVIALSTGRPADLDGTLVAIGEGSRRERGAPSAGIAAR